MNKVLALNKNTCPTVKDTINKISGKWKPGIINNVRHKSQRFGKLLFLMEPISSKMLSSQLKELESDGLIQRIEFDETVPRVEYSLTEKGNDMLPILDQIYEWSLKNGE